LDRKCRTSNRGKLQAVTKDVHEHPADATSFALQQPALWTVSRLDDNFDVLGGWTVLRRGRVKAPNYWICTRSHPRTVANPATIDRLLHELHQIDSVSS